MTMGHCILLDKDDANLYKSAQDLVTCDPFLLMYNFNPT